MKIDLGEALGLKELDRPDTPEKREIEDISYKIKVPSPEAKKPDPLRRFDTTDEQREYRKAVFARHEKSVDMMEDQQDLLRSKIQRVQNDISEAKYYLDHKTFSDFMDRTEDVGISDKLLKEMMLIPKINLEL